MGHRLWIVLYKFYILLTNYYDELLKGNCIVTDEEMEEAAKIYLEAKDKNDTRTLDKLKKRFDGFQKIEDFITKKNQERENAASLAAIQD